MSSQSSDECLGRWIKYQNHTFHGAYDEGIQGLTRVDRPSYVADIRFFVLLIIISALGYQPFKSNPYLGQGHRQRFPSSKLGIDAQTAGGSDGNSSHPRLHSILPTRYQFEILDATPEGGKGVARPREAR